MESYPVTRSNAGGDDKVQGSAAMIDTPESTSSYGAYYPCINDPLQSNLIPDMLETVDWDPFSDWDEPIKLSSACGSCSLHLGQLQERWSVDQDAAAYLSSIVAFSDIHDAEELVEMPHVFHARLRVENPMLSCDTDLELQQIRQRNRVRLSSRGMAPFPLSKEADEAMQWPSRCMLYPQIKDDQIANEKLTIPKDTVELLMHISHLEVPTRQEIDTAFVDEAKPRSQRYITPPLLPLSPSLSPLHLPNNVQHVDLTSSPEDPTAMEAAELDRQIIARDDHGTSNIDPIDGMSSPALDEIRYFTKISSGFVSSPAFGMRSHTPRIDVPLLPASPDISSPMSAEVLSIRGALLTHVPVVKTDAPMLSEGDLQEDIETFMNEVVIPLAEPGRVQSENERLVELDTTMRVDVPSILDRPPAAPWRAFGGLDPSVSRLQHQRVLLRQTFTDFMHDIRKWSGMSKIEKILPWSAFPARLARVETEEDFDDGSADRYMDELLADAKVNRATMIPTMDKLTLVDDTNDDVDLEPVQLVEEEYALAERTTYHSSPQPDDHEALNQPRVSRFFDTSGGLQPARPHEAASAAVVLQTPKERAAVSLPKEPNLAVSELLPTASRQYAPRLETVRAIREMPAMQARTSMRALLAKRKLELDAYFPNKKVTANFDVTTSGTQPLHNLSNGSSLASFLRLQGGTIGSLAEALDVPALPITKSVVDATTDELPLIVESRPLPVPKVVGSSQSMQIVLSPQVYADRAMVRRLMSLLPNLDPIERSNLTVGEGRHTTEPHKNTSHAEADIILSPSTGLVLTTLQQLKQKPLPGQTSFHGIREHVSAVAHSYETLLVLVHDGRPQPSLDDNDTDALCDFISYTLATPTHIQVLYVPDSLEKWLASTILQHIVLCTSATRLLPDETTWERFLRVAGMNAFAAQVVLNQLKAPEVLQPQSESSSAGAGKVALFGLAAFLRMSLDERIQRFGPVMGGRRVLERVSAVVDGKWQVAGD